jgi:MFS family permease
VSSEAPRTTGERALSKETILSLYLPAVMLSLGVGIAAPVLPAYAKSFHVSFSTAALILIVQPWGSVLSTFPTGYLIDRLGRKPILLLGPLLTAITAFLTAFAWSFAVLLIFRFLNGMAAQMWQQSRLAMIADTASDSERGKLITWMNTTQRFGMLFAPLLGGVVAGYDLRLPFILHGVLVLTVLAPSFLLAKETAPEGTRGKASRDGEWTYVFAELKKPQLRWFLAAQVFANLTRGNIQGILNLYMAYEYHRGPQSLGIIASANSIANIPIGFATGTIMDRYGRKKTVVPGFSGLAVSGAFLAFTALAHSPFWVFLIGYFMLNVSQGVTSGNMQVLGADLAPARARGRFIGLWRFMAEFGNASSPTMFSLFALVGYALSFSFTGTCALFVALIIGLKMKETLSLRAEIEPVEVAAPPTATSASAEDSPLG